MFSQETLFIRYSPDVGGFVASTRSDMLTRDELKDFIDDILSEYAPITRETVNEGMRRLGERREG